MKIAIAGISVFLLASFTVIPRPGHLTAEFALLTVLPLLAILWLGLEHLHNRWWMARGAERPSSRLCERIAVAREEERSRLRGDLHDGLGPALAGIRLRLDVAATRVSQPSARRLILDAADETSRTVDDIRCIIDDLRPPDLEAARLPEALRRLAERIGAGAPLKLRTELPDSGTLPGLSFATELAAYRIASEGLANVLRHAGAHTATLRLTDEGRWLVLEVLDDGIGPPAAARDQGVGLRSMAQRAEDVGGHCAVLPRTDAPTGTLVRAVLPRDAS